MGIGVLKRISIRKTKTFKVKSTRASVKESLGAIVNCNGIRLEFGNRGHDFPNKETHSKCA